MKFFLLDEETEEGFYEPVSCLEKIAADFKTFTKNNLIDFEAEKQRENLFW